MYYFKIGDHVETTDGRTGHIIDFCKCDLCKQRGFYEPIIKYLDQEEPDYISKYDMYNGFRRFLRVGEYTFNNPVEKFKERETEEPQGPKYSDFEVFLKKWCAQKATEKEFKG